MIALIASSLDPASRNISKFLVSEFGFEKSSFAGRECFRSGKIVLEVTQSELVHAQSVDELGCEMVYFLSRHRSAGGIASFTTHPLGNWGGEARMGGEPRELSFAAPAQMLAVLRAISRIDAKGVERTYEATHHGPLLKTPSLFVELGGNDAAISDSHLATLLGRALWDALDDRGEPAKIAIGIGGSHYPRKFTSLALEKRYAFSHIMPRHAIVEADGLDNTAMLEQAFARSNRQAEVAVIEWKSINANTRNRVIKRLGQMGLDYERA